ncbi:MAG: phosphate transport system ATP-binding protein, partial [Myxococcota bacterium]
MVERASSTPGGEERPVKLKVRDLSIYYGDTPALENVNFDIYENEIFGIIGPANSGKTSFLRTINRMDLATPGMKFTGDIEFAGHNVKKWRNVYSLRRRIGVVFPLP